MIKNIAYITLICCFSSAFSTQLGPKCHIMHQHPLSKMATATTKVSDDSSNSKSKIQERSDPISNIQEMSDPISNIQEISDPISNIQERSDNFHTYDVPVYRDIAQPRKDSLDESSYNIMGQILPNSTVDIQRFIMDSEEDIRRLAENRKLAILSENDRAMLSQKITRSSVALPLYKQSASNRGSINREGSFYENFRSNRGSFAHQAKDDEIATVKQGVRGAFSSKLTHSTVILPSYKQPASNRGSLNREGSFYESFCSNRSSFAHQAQNDKITTAKQGDRGMLSSKLTQSSIALSSRKQPISYPGVRMSADMSRQSNSFCGRTSLLHPTREDTITTIEQVVFSSKIQQKKNVFNPFKSRIFIACDGGGVKTGMQISYLWDIFDALDQRLNEYLSTLFNRSNILHLLQAQVFPLAIDGAGGVSAGAWVAFSIAVGKFKEYAEAFENHMSLVFHSKQICGCCGGLSAAEYLDEGRLLVIEKMIPKNINRLQDLKKIGASFCSAYCEATAENKAVFVDSNDQSQRNWCLKDILEWTSNLPGAFKLNGKIDGGLVANNFTLHMGAFIVKNYYGADAESFIISLGSGKIATNGDLGDASGSLWSLKNNIGDLMVDFNSDSLCQLCYIFLPKLNLQFKRVQFAIDSQCATTAATKKWKPKYYAQIGHNEFTDHADQHDDIINIIYENTVKRLEYMSNVLFENELTDAMAYSLLELINGLGIVSMAETAFAKVMEYSEKIKVSVNKTFGIVNNDLHSAATFFAVANGMFDLNNQDNIYNLNKYLDFMRRSVYESIDHELVDHKYKSYLCSSVMNELGYSLVLYPELGNQEYSSYIGEMVESVMRTILKK